MYSQKTIQDLKPEWYMLLSKKDKRKIQDDLINRRGEMWADKPKPVKRGSILIARKTIKSITFDRKYRVMGYFATLVTTIYDSTWNEFVTLKTDNGYTVKMNLRKFTKP